MKNDKSEEEGLWGCLFIFVVVMLGIIPMCMDGCSGRADSSRSSDDIDKIVAAQDYVRNYVAKYPDTLDFYDWSYSPKVNGNTVTLKFSCKNAFGVQETNIMDIKVE